MSSRLGIAGSAVAFATMGVYLAVILPEADDSPAEFVPWAATFGGIGLVAAAASVLRRGSGTALLFAGAAGTALALGLLALWSIGVLLLAVAALLIGASREAWPEPETAVRRTLAATAGAAAITLAVVIATL